MTSSSIETAQATLHRPATDRLEIRIKPHVTITLPGIFEIFTRLDGQGWAGAPKLLVVFPDMPVDFDLPVISQDHLTGRPATTVGSDLAMVITDPLTLRFIELHFAYFPAVITTRIFTSEEEANTWLDRPSA